LIALYTANLEAGWVHKILIGIPFVSKSIQLVLIHCNSQTIIAKAKSKNFHEKRRHMTIRHKSIRHLISNGIISLVFVRSENSIVNPLTKNLVHHELLNHRGKIRLKPLN
jgi:hypothetical protein